MCAGDIQDFGGPAGRHWIAAQAGHGQIGYGLIDFLFVQTEVTPISFLQPARTAARPHSGVPSADCLGMFLNPTFDEPVEIAESVGIKGPIAEVLVMVRNKFQISVSKVAVKVRDGVT